MKYQILLQIELFQKETSKLKLVYQGLIVASYICNLYMLYSKSVHVIDTAL